MKGKYYIRHSILPFEEDIRHEFKAHRCFSTMDLSGLKMTFDRNGQLVKEKIKYRRSTLSKHFCGMLNTGLGGTFFLGVTDKAAVEGFIMSPYQRDHVRLSLWHLFQSFHPKVPKHMYKVRFVPVVDEPSEVAREIGTIHSLSRNLKHELKESRYCWCDSYTCSSMEMGLLHRFYVIEIDFTPWDPSDGRNRHLLNRDAPNVNPMFANEENNFYLRMNGGTAKLSPQQVRDVVLGRLKLPPSFFENCKMNKSIFEEALDSDSEGYQSYHDYDEDCYLGLF